MCAATRMEPLENSTPQWSLCEHEHAKGKRHLSIIIKTVLTALAPCKDLRDTRPCFENDLTYGQVQKKKIRETSYLNFKTEKHHQAPKPASREKKNSHPILKMKQQKDAVLSFCRGYTEKLQHDRSRGQTCHHTQPPPVCLQQDEATGPAAGKDAGAADHGDNDMSAVVC